MSRRGGSGWNAAMLVAGLIWGLGQVLGQLAGPAEGMGAEPLPRGATDTPRGRVAQLPVDSRRRGDATTGTAWHAGGGIWFSNRHVVEGCAEHRLGERDAVGIDNLWAHPDADLAAVRSRGDREPIPLARAAPERRARAYAVGYPQGRPGIVELSLRGEGVMELTGSLRSERPFRYKVWGVNRLPDHVASAARLGGISGGVVVDRSGHALGVAFGGNGRRGTLLTIPHAELNAAARSLAEARPRADVRADHGPDIERHLRDLLRSDRVARVLCRY